MSLLTFTNSTEFHLNNDYCSADLLPGLHFNSSYTTALNIIKTKYIRFKMGGGKAFKIATDDLKIENTVIERITNIKFLGVLIDESLKWGQQMAKVANTISRNIGILKCIRYKVDSGTALLIYDTMLVLHLNLLQHCLGKWLEYRFRETA